ncbi:ParB/RepB/Spo0J family partition protein [Sphaerotilus montanus]|uniref:ParB family chromosome partitioning protein n=1 Tax=Sphaerotilus montanus TaxID=522889 RepID=A0A7Y9U911_9BURK|nr:ParB/RepB/Spo0J family partition protein [Sphaerotilus montanus]NYG35487.1 ParB family chromosome partitioning protein [Sphaerotilus montanus]NZD58642.1 ParB/RepB/Spo0J family partition protein [Sphaerotilus montanus]
MEPRKMNVKPSGLLGADQKAERERRLAMAVGRLPSFAAAATPPSEVARDEPAAPTGSSSTQVIDPKLIVRSRWANRHQANFSGEEFGQLREEIRQAGGNVQAIKVRPLRSPVSAVQPGEVVPRYEIVFGHRRHEACLLEGLPVLAVVADVDDRTLFIEMDRENRSRKDLTAWEQGVMYLKALDTGLFPSKRALASALGVDHSALAKAVTLAELPQAIIDAFSSPLDLQFRWGQPLAAIFAADPDTVLARAAMLKEHRGKMNARSIFEQLINGKDVKSDANMPAEPIKIDQGGKRADISMTAKGGAVVNIAPGSIGPERLKDLAELVTKFLAGM